MDLISKKELLAVTGISYGQLYRWKREKLIPEEWFLKKSAYTGQETFFPREQILSRVRTILEAKDHYSLEQLARMLAPEGGALQFPAVSLPLVEEVAPALRQAVHTACPAGGYTLEQLALFAAVSRCAGEAQLTQVQAELLLQRALSAAQSCATLEKTTLLALLVEDEVHVALAEHPEGLWLDGGCSIAASCALGEMQASLKLKYQSKFARSKADGQEEA